MSIHLTTADLVHVFTIIKIFIKPFLPGCEKNCDSNVKVISSYNERFLFCQANDLIKKLKNNWVSEFWRVWLKWTPELYVRQEGSLSRVGQEFGIMGWDSRKWFASGIMLPARQKEHNQYEKKKTLNESHPFLKTTFFSQGFLRLWEKKIKICI